MGKRLLAQLMRDNLFETIPAPGPEGLGLTTREEPISGLRGHRLSESTLPPCRTSEELRSKPLVLVLPS
jgi:hypothetical protein